MSEWDALAGDEPAVVSVGVAVGAAHRAPPAAAHLGLQVHVRACEFVARSSAAERRPSRRAWARARRAEDRFLAAWERFAVLVGPPWPVVPRGLGVALAPSPLEGLDDGSARALSRAAVDEFRRAVEEDAT